MVINSTSDNKLQSSKDSKTLVIGHLYPKQMNVYGDMGNILTLQYRLQQRGIEVKYVAVDSLKTITEQKIDILVGGGGQDSNQELVQNDLKKYGAELVKQCNDGMVALMICGMYQLFGNKFILPDGFEVEGIGFFNMETRAGQDRLIGNVVVSSDFGTLVGFENHSGRTYLQSGLASLGRVLKGAGNNGEDGTEGAIHKNVFGTYMHGPGLAKNPQLADELISRALVRKYGTADLAQIDDSIEQQASTVASKRPR